MNNIELWKENFYEYYCKFDTMDSAIERKYWHSIRVMNLCGELAIYNKLSNKDIEIAILIGLLHDISRFYQWTKYKTYDDLKSVDHGDLAVKILFDDNEIRKYISDDSYDEIIYNSIKYHNKYSFPDDFDDRNKMFCKLIRDADKLDIFSLISVDDNMIKEDESDISRDLIEEFYNNKSLNRGNVKNLNDIILLDLAMFFDFNYLYSYKYINDNELIWKIYDKLSNKERFMDYFVYVDSYVKKKLL